MSIQRRKFIKNLSLATAGLAFANVPTYSFAMEASNDEFTSKRPLISNRKFTSKAVEKKITEVKSLLIDKELAWMFENCFPNTLDTTVQIGERNGKPDTYVITGDIDAMWLRDSSAQVWPYLPLMKNDKELQNLIAGVVNRHAFYVLIDPYANAFFNDPNRKGHDDTTLMQPWVHERKWEVDSLCYVIRLAHGYWKASGDTSCFDENWQKSMKKIVATFKSEQRKNGKSEYNFKRKTDRPHDTAAGGGAGSPIKPIGLICSVFRPSDDGTVFPFLIPSNYFAVKSLKQLSEMANEVLNDKVFAKECDELATEIETALAEYAVINHKTAGKILAYEIDGFGAQYLIDDSNIPSLISLPYLDAIDKENELYKRTREFLLTEGNHPYYAKGKAAEGTTGPHAGKEMIWPMGIIVRAMTSDNDEEIKKCLKMLKETHANTGFMHEAFDKDDASHFTRKWFAWANTLFGELILKLIEEKPYLLT